MQLDIMILFFMLGVVARLIGSELKLPKGLYQAISLFLMLAIGLKGGMALAEHVSLELITQSLIIMLLGLLFPLIAFPILNKIGAFSKNDSAAIAAHFGSVSIGTFAVAIALLESQNIVYETYFPLFVVLLEFPAIVVGFMLAKDKNSNVSMSEWGKEIISNQSMVLMFGGLIIGLIAGEQSVKVMPLFSDLFYGVLALFLLEMGIVAAERIKDLKQNGLFLTAFSMVMPIINGTIGGAVGTFLGFSAGGIFLTIVLSASVSYIAVPLAMRSLLPTANHSLGLTASLGVAFPFNIVIGLPLYWLMASWYFNFVS
ncbi:MAG: sodium-dependent bicarbonate transport family permease [Kangiellaceae bacterium]